MKVWSVLSIGCVECDDFLAGIYVTPEEANDAADELRKEHPQSHQGARWSHDLGLYTPGWKVRIIESEIDNS